MFLMHMAIWKQEKMPVHSEMQAQVGALLSDKTPTKILVKYSNYNNIFLMENVAKLLENIGMNEHAIKLEEGKQLPFDPIYSSELVKFKTLKTYIKTNLANSFIQPSRSPAGASIFLIRS